MLDKRTYSEKLRDPRWQKKRLIILERDQWTCQKCYLDDKTLHVHHRRYDKQYKNPWEYQDELLVTLCEDCHAQETACMPDTLKYLAEVFQERFFSHEILTIIKGLEKYSMPHIPEVCATAIAFSFENEEQARLILSNYFEDLFVKSGRTKDLNAPF